MSEIQLFEREFPYVESLKQLNYGRLPNPKPLAQPICAIAIVRACFYNFGSFQVLKTEAFGDQISIKSNATPKRHFNLKNSFRLDENTNF